MSELTIELLLNHFDFVVAAVSVDVFQHHTVVIPPLVKASASDTPQQTRKYPQMDVVSMLKSNDAFVPCRNLSFGNRLSLTAMEKAAAFPLHAGFMPNSPMPMLDACDWLLLMTVSTTSGWWVVSCKFCCFESELSRICCVEMYLFFLARAGRTPFEWPPRMTYSHANDAHSDARSVMRAQ